jgi:hypothetical protein
MNFNIKAILLAVTVLVPHPQQGQDVFYVESWKRGARQVQEQKLYITLNKARPEYETLIKDTSGKARYKLLLWPGRINGKDSGIAEWMVELIDLTREREGTLLRPSNDKEQDYFTAKDRIGWLYPLKNPQSISAESDVVPIFAKRVVKVENFYLIIEVKDFHFSPNKEALNSIAVQVKFTNSYKETLKLTALGKEHTFPKN